MKAKIGKRTPSVAPKKGAGVSKRSTSRSENEKGRSELATLTGHDCYLMEWGVQDSETSANLRLAMLSCGELRIPTESRDQRSSTLRSTAPRCWQPVLSKAQAPILSSARSPVPLRRGLRVAT